MRYDKGLLVITGASGFIGARLVAAALSEGWNVTALLRDPSRLAHLDCVKLRTESWSIGQEPIGNNILSGADAIVHLAAFVPPDHENSGYATECFRVNALGTLALARQASEANVGRFVFFSSGQIYSVTEKVASERALVYPAHRATYYLSSKLNAELFLQHQSYTKGLAVTILRVAAVYGEGMPGTGIIPVFIKRISESCDIHVLDGGTYAVDFVHVDDVVSAALRVIEKRIDGVLNVGSGQARTSLEVADILVKVMKADRSNIKVHDPEGTSYPPGFPALDIEKARRAFDYHPLTLEQGLTLWLSH